MTTTNTIAASSQNSTTSSSLNTLKADFLPNAPHSLAEAGLSEAQVDALILKFLLSVSSASGRRIAEQLALPFALVQNQLFRIKGDRLIVMRAGAPLGDYIYEATEIGLERGRRYFEHCNYFGAAPVPFCDYLASIEAQSIHHQQPTMTDLRAAFGDMLLSTGLLTRVGEAIHSGLGMILYGAPGNGKTSIAERLTGALGKAIWIPRSIQVGGDIIRLYDSSKHEALPIDESLEDVDRRWILIRRPTIVCGGELTLDQFEVTANQGTGVLEASLQMKSNCGTLVIDDLGRQSVPIQKLLDRFIIPLERHHDYITTPSGQRFQTPIDQMIVFSTNIDPAELEDEALLRRIPYKIELLDPTDAEFCELFVREARAAGIPIDLSVIVAFVARHFKATGRGFRYCQPRDLMRQIRTACSFRGIPLAITESTLEAAALNYFGGHGSTTDA